MTPPPPADALATAAFWRAAGYERWFAKSDVFDAMVRMRLGRIAEAAHLGLLDHWDETPVGTVALLTLLDQVPRNLHRGTPRAFASDDRALAVATAAVARRFDRRLPKEMRWFVYLPFEHAESIDAQEIAVALFRDLGDPDGLEYAEIHADIIRRFGRFPHRNEILGRTSTKQELKFLAEGGFSG